MSIKYVILGFLSETPLTGYDLKKKFSNSDLFHWSGNNNQIYRALAELHQENRVTIEVQYQESKPPRKIYTLTDEGMAALKQWMLSLPELPQFRNALLVQLTWADQLEPDDLDKMLAKYEEELRVHVLMLREQARRNTDSVPTQPPATALKDRVAEHWISFYELELDWVRNLRQQIVEP
ncbi:MAG: PadR family transcriptional regulator [Anaerolineae bacterium]|nr:PadR family transcriptional regulator [Anaerolineae bacterium]